MSLKIDVTPRSYAMAGNPIRLDINSTSIVNYTIKIDDKTFSGVTENSSSLFIDDVIKSYIIPSRLRDNDGKIVQECSNMITAKICAKNEEGETQDKELKVLYGAISKRAYRNLIQNGTNIFTYKLLNKDANFFMSSRNEGNLIKIRETELLPLLFVAPCQSFSVKSGKLCYDVKGLVIGSCYALNIDGIRKYFYNENDSLVNEFSVCVDDKTVTRIIIENTKYSKDRMFLDFINSYGAYERIEILGKPSMSQEMSDEENFGTYDIDINDYVTTRDRVLSTEKINVFTGFINESEYRFILDMLASDEIYLRGYEGREIKVHSQADSLSLSKNMNTPQNIELILTFADPERNYTESLMDDDYGNPRIFTEQFVKQFN